MQAQREEGMASQPRSPHLHFTNSQMGSALQKQGLSLRGLEKCLGALTEEEELAERRKDPVFVPLYPACMCCIVLLVR